MNKQFRIGLGLLVIASIAVAVWLLIRNTQNTRTTTLPGKDMSASEVAKLPAQQTFLAYIQHAFTQPHVTLTKEWRTGSAPGMQPQDMNTTYARSYVDYNTDAYVYAQHLVLAGTTDAIKARCTPEGESRQNSATLAWSAFVPSENIDTCGKYRLHSNLGDGFSTGGLTSAQSKAFTDYLESTDGLLHVTAAPLDHKGADYVRYTAKLSAIRFDDTLNPDSPPMYEGTKHLDNALYATGLKTDDHPYEHAGNPFDGMQLTYVINPATQLPVYSELAPLPGKDATGKDTPVAIPYLYKNEYDFRAAPFDIEATKDETIHMRW